MICVNFEVLEWPLDLETVVWVRVAQVEGVFGDVGGEVAAGRRDVMRECGDEEEREKDEGMHCDRTG